MITTPIIARTGSRLLLAVCLLLGGIAANECVAATKGDKKKAAFPAKEYDPNTKAYCDFLWMRVHEENCPALVMKDMKKVITLEQADKEGWRIGLTGQSGNDHCCFHGYRRKHPRKEITDDDTFGIANPMKRGNKHKFHQAGCHRTRVKPNHTMPMTLREAKKLKGYYICSHCVNRGPSVTKVTTEAVANMPVAKEFVAPAGWSRKPVPADKLPPQKEIDMLVEEYLYDVVHVPTPFEDPRAQAEELITRRFFFGFSNVYKLYRATGDKRLLDKLYESAQHPYKICVKYPSAAQAKAKGPEGANFLFPVVGWSRITLQLARKGKASQKEIAEAEAMLKAVVVALKRHWYWEGDTGLDPKMGIPQQLADNFKRSAYNRCANGIGTVATASKALEDLQAIRKTTKYQRTIDCYRKCVQEWIKNWETMGCMYTEADGKTYFYYTYNGTGKKREDGLMFGGDDIYHYSYSVEGATLIWEAAPELGVDNDFMTAIANAVYHNAGTKNGSIQCPSADRIKPRSRKPGPGVAVPKFYGLEAFRNGLIDASCQRLSKAKKIEVNSDKHRLGGRRVRTMFAHYLKALRKDRNLIHLGEKN